MNTQWFLSWSNLILSAPLKPLGNCQYCSSMSSDKYFLTMNGIVYPEKTTKLCPTSKLDTFPSHLSLKNILYSKLSNDQATNSPSLNSVANIYPHGENLAYVNVHPSLAKRLRIFVIEEFEIVFHSMHTSEERVSIIPSLAAMSIFWISLLWYVLGRNLSIILPLRAWIVSVLSLCAINA